MTLRDQLKLSSTIGTVVALRDELEQSGMVAMATVLNFAPGPVYGSYMVGDQTWAFFMTLRVEPVGAEQFQVTNHEFLFKEFDPWLGEVVPVIYDPADPSRMVLDRRYEVRAAAARINEPNLPKDLTAERIHLEWSLAHGDETNRRISDFADASAKAVSVARNLGELPSDPAAALARLGEMRTSGELSDEQFDAERRRILDQI
jgi:hypothetical protein